MVIALAAVDQEMLLATNDQRLISRAARGGVLPQEAEDYLVSFEPL
jgi:hypothetical protein